MSAPLKSFEGPDVQLLLDRIRAELGPGAKINGAEKVRVGGVLGFFAKEHYRVIVEAPAPGPLPVPEVTPPAPADRVTGRRGRSRVEEPPPAATSVRSGAMGPGAFAGPPPPAAVPATTGDVFSAMAEATDDLVDIGAAPSSTAGAVDHGGGGESFDAVLSRVATSLETAPAPGARFDGGVAPGPETTDGDGRGRAPGIASRAAQFLAEADRSVAASLSLSLSPAPRTGPGPSAVVARRLRRAGMDEASVARVSEGLAHGGGLDALLLESFAALPAAPALPRRPGSLLVVVGPAGPARRLAAAVATDMGIDPTAVPVASRDGGIPVTGTLLVRSAEDAAELAPGWRRSQPAVVVVDAAVAGTERSWATHVVAALRPTAVWGVVDATAKTEDIAAWAETLKGIDALALENLDATVSPAAALAAGIPVARLDGQPATAARWVATMVDRVTPCT